MLKSPCFSQFKKVLYDLVLLYNKKVTSMEMLYSYFAKFNLLYNKTK